MQLKEEVKFWILLEDSPLRSESINPSQISFSYRKLITAALHTDKNPSGSTVT